MTQEQIDKVVKFTAITVFKYCMGNKLDFSMDEPEDVDAEAEEMYNEMLTADKELKN